MSENKEYWASPLEQGSVKISDEVIASIAALAVSEVDGVHSLSSDFGADIAELFGRKVISKGIKAVFTDSTVDIDVYIVIKYGYVISNVTSEIQQKVLSTIEAMTGIKVNSINVNVVGISFDKKCSARTMT